jgi:ABC-2 type transport system ATP-binding protein
MLLRVSALTKSFAVGTLGQRRKEVLRGVDLQVAPGEVCVVMGDNGSGKTTLLRIIAAVLTPESGQVEVAGHSVRSDSAARALTGFASGEERSFQLRLSGLDNLRFFAALYGLKQEAVSRRIAELSEALDLSSFIGIPVGQCSAGMRARLGLARALLHQPRLLLLDEPSKSIDEAHLPAVRASIERHTSAGGGALIVTHSSDEARAISKRVEVLESGRLRARGLDATRLDHAPRVAGAS